MTATSNEQLALAAKEFAAKSDGLQRRAAQTAYVALWTTGTVGAARSALSDLWQRDVQQAALDLIGRLAAEALVMMPRCPERLAVGNLLKRCHRQAGHKQPCHISGVSRRPYGDAGQQRIRRAEWYPDCLPLPGPSGRPNPPQSVRVAISRQVCGGP